MLKQPVLLVCLLLMLFQASPVAARSIDMGDRFPEIDLPQPAESSARDYLGLPAGESFTLSQVKADVVLVEMLNVLCPHCRKQTLPYNNLYDLIEKDPQTKGRIKMLGIAVGNSDEQIEDFVDIYAVDFPVVSDRSFKLHTAIKAGPTPFSIYLKRDGLQPAVVAGTHLGEDREMDDLFSYLKEMLSLPVSEFADLPADDDDTGSAIAPFLPAELMTKRILDSFMLLGEVSQFEKLALASQREVYTARIGKQRIFAEVLARSAICDVCHNVHFYYLFDTTGKIIAFEPLHLTRYGNVEWSDEEVAQMRRRLVGGYLSVPWNFDPQVDAITRATMTSAIIFNSIDQGKMLLEELEQYKYLNGKYR